MAVAAPGVNSVPVPPAFTSRWAMYPATASASIAFRWKEAATRCASWRMLGCSTIAFSSGWPTRMSWISSSLPELMLVSSRSSSSPSMERFCASSKIRIAGFFNKVRAIATRCC